MHLNVKDCVGCEDKLKGVHPDLARFVRLVRSTLPEAHISCGSRGEAEQEADFKKSVSRAHYGQSAHNVVPSMAVDFFRLTQTAGASFDKVWYETCLAPIVAGAGLVWGGSWKSIKDMPHVELPGFIPFKAVT